MNIDKVLLKKVIFAAIILSFAWLLIWLLFFTAITRIEVSRSAALQEGNYKLTARNAENEDQRIINLAGYSFIPRSSTQLVAEAEGFQAKTIHPIDGLGLWNQPIVMKLEAQKNVEHATNDSLGCRIFTSKDSYDYNCGFNEGLFSYDDTEKTWGNVKNFVSRGLIYQFKDGYLTLGSPNVAGDSEPTYIEYVNLINAEKRNVEVPDEVTNLVNSIIITDKTNTQSESFWIIDKESGYIFYSDNYGQKYTRLNLPEDLDRRFEAFVCDGTNAKLFCYYGAKDHYDSPEETAFFKDNEKYKFVIFDFNNQQTSYFEFSDTPAETIAVDSNENVFIVAEDILMGTRFKDDKAESYPILEEAYFVSSGDSISFVFEGSVYKFEGEDIIKYFGSNNISIKTMSSYGDKLYISGVSGDKQQFSYGYIVTNKENANKPGNRFEDIFPIDVASPLVRKIDAFGSRIKIELALDMVTNKATGEYFYVSESQYNEARSIADETLKQAGVPLDKYEIIYSY